MAYDALTTYDPLSPDDLLKAHRLLMDNLVDRPGEFRSVGVGVFSGDTCVHLSPPYDRVPALIDNLFAWCRSTDVHPLIQSAVFHYEHWKGIEMAKKGQRKDK